MYGQKRVIIVAPTFSGYGEGIEEPNLYRIPLNHKDHFGFPFQAIMDTLQPEDLLFLGNPNNPTGNLFPRQQLVETIYHAHAIGAMVVIDEAFIDFVEDLSCSLRDIAADIDNLIVVGSATKFFAMPGLRLGYAIASLPNVGKMERLLPSWRINSFACYAAMAALKDDNYIKQTRRLINEERDFLEACLRNIPGLQGFSSKVNFVLVNSQATGSSAAELQERLGPKGILIRNCSNFDNLSPFYFRLAVRTRPENQRLLMALNEVVGTSNT
jgi:threonine-phosphate decarboxylase